MLTFDELHRAVARCMDAHPPAGLDFQMHSDANVIAGLWDLISYERSSSVPFDQIKPEVLDAYRRWAESSS